MIFINPKTDFAFKKIFGSSDSKDILMSLLNAILYEGQPVIEDVEIIDPSLAPRVQGLKDSYLDVKARINDGTTVIIEMQVLDVEAFGKRILYNAAKTYSLQLQKREGYMKLNPVIAITITDFVMFDEFEKVISRFIYKEKQYNIEYGDNDIELVFVELPKFTKQLEDLETLTDKWIYFIKSAPSLEIVPPTMGSVPALQKAFEIANEANLSREELEELEKREIFLEDVRGATIKAIREGREEGIREKSIEIARQLINVLDDATIAQTTGLSIEEIQRLREE